MEKGKEEKVLVLLNLQDSRRKRVRRLEPNGVDIAGGLVWTVLVSTLKCHQVRNGFIFAAPGNGGEQGLRRKIIELEVELRDVKEKLRMQQEENTDGSSRGIRKVHSESLLMRIAGYEEEMRDAREKLRLSEEEIARLKIEVQTNRSQEVTNDLEAELELSEKDVRSLGANLEMEQKQAMDIGEKIDGLKAEVSDPDCKIQTLEEELKITKEKLKGSEREIANLRNELENSGSTIRRLQDQLGSAQKDVATWKAKIDKEQREVSKLQDRMLRYKAKDNLKEWEHRCQSLEEEIRRVKAGKTEMEGLLQAGMEQLKVTFKLEYDTLMEERDELNAKIATLIAEVSARDDQIEHMDQHLKQLHMEHVELIAGTEGAQRKVEELRSRVRELEEEVEKQREVIIEGAEEKREAIRQLCFSLEHYRNGYHRLRQAFVGHKRFPVMAA
ncbi:Protein NETWORKED 4B [Camellia lanceoleosa]|uniref:Protein NETWORKED 4B n=1 Tax=Camellia lanceoleosa TaxID=1840588 RepID=A0ACC0F3E4_9ERIC|nr:Protein NETWORKED 4B [Camellia lanceoleosa]